MARLLIVDDHEVIRFALRSILGRKWVVCGEASNGVEAIEMTAALRPDVVVLDLTMPLMNGLEAASKIKAIAPTVKIVVYSMHDIPATAREIGADAFVSKSSVHTALPLAIERVLGAAA